MRPSPILLVALVVSGGIGPALQAQQKPRRESPTLMPTTPAPAATPRANPPESTTTTKGRRPPPTLVNRPGVTVDSSRTAARNAAAQQSVAPQAARTPATPVADFTAGLAIAPYAGESEADLDRYFRQFTTQLDSAAATMTGVFRGTTGQPVPGVEAPSSLSQRERDRWGRCRDLHYDLQSYATAMHELVEQLPEDAAVQRAGHALDTALTALQATAECDNVTSMIAAPGRWTPWGAQYTTTARTFYSTWYGQLRDVADRNRALVIALNVTRPAGSRQAVPPAMARNAPYVGSGPR